jgi:hypothetical protein
MLSVKSAVLMCMVCIDVLLSYVVMIRNKMLTYLSPITWHSNYRVSITAMKQSYGTSNRPWPIHQIMMKCVTAF